MSTNNLIIFEIDDWAVIEDKNTGERHYEGHNGMSLLQAFINLLKIETVYFEDDIDYEESERTGNIDSSILRWKMKNGR